MDQSTHKKIQEIVANTKAGTILFPTDFRGTGSEGAIKMSLSRLVKEKELDRLAHGIYLKPDYHPTYGKLQPALEEIAQSIANKEQVRIKPSGAYALNRLGLSTQIPLRLVYITDGPRREFTIGHGGIKFKPSAPKRFAMKGEISSLLFQALEELGHRQALPLLDQIKALIKKENPLKLNHDLKLAPAWINDLIIFINKESSIHDRMAKVK